MESVNIEDQESKVEEGKIDESSSRRIHQELEEGKIEDYGKHEGSRLYQRRRRLLRSTNGETKEDDSTSVEETKLRDFTPSPKSRPDKSSSSSAYIIRKGLDEKLKRRLQQRLRAEDYIPEIHFIGEIVEGIGFKGTYFSCKWYLEWGKSWSLLEGEQSTGQTQYTHTASNVWNHPIDVHFASTSMEGWPRIIVQVWRLDTWGRAILTGYGFTHLPTNPGYHELEIMCWMPTNGTIREKLEEFFLGKTPSCLLDEALIFRNAWEDRFRLTTVSSGMVKLNVTVVLRFFHEQNVK